MDDADGLVAMEKQHLLQLKKSLETETSLIQQQLKVIAFDNPHKHNLIEKCQE